MDYYESLKRFRLLLEDMVVEAKTIKPLLIKKGLPGTLRFLKTNKISMNTPEDIAKQNAIVEILEKLWDNEFLNDDILYEMKYLYKDDVEDWEGSYIEEALWNIGDKRTLKEIYEDQYDEELSKDDIEFFEPSDDIFEWAMVVKGETSDLNEAGYILPSGSLLDFSGKKEGGGGGRRQEDHRQLPLPIVGSISGTDLMIAFMKMGAIRMDMNSGLIDVAKKPTPQQLQIVGKVLKNGGYIDLIDSDNKRHSQEVVNASSAIQKIREFYGT
jgi:hypothetical protein